MKPGPAADLALVEHMRGAIARIHAYSGQDAAVFHGSTLVQDGVIRNLQTLTESSQRLSEAIKATEAQIPWRELGAFRNVLVHAYLGVDLKVVWSVVAADLPALAQALARMQARLGGSGGNDSTVR